MSRNARVVKPGASGHHGAMVKRVQIVLVIALAAVLAVAAAAFDARAALSDAAGLFVVMLAPAFVAVRGLALAIDPRA